MAENSVARVLNIPEGMPIARHRPPPKVEIPEGVTELPLMDGKSPDKQKLQEIWTAQVEVFDLSDDEQLKAYKRVWQKVTDGHARVCEHRTEFSGTGFLALLRWADLSYNIPKS